MMVVSLVNVRKPGRKKLVTDRSETVGVKQFVITAVRSFHCMLLARRSHSSLARGSHPQPNDLPRLKRCYRCSRPESLSVGRAIRWRVAQTNFRSSFQQASVGERLAPEV